LSEMAGAARELTDALLINPNDVTEMAQKIKAALEMVPAEQEKRMVAMQKRVKSYDVGIWAEDFMTGLQDTKQKQKSFQEIFLDEYSKRAIMDTFREAKRRLLLLDYDGTLVSYSSSPELAIPTPELLGLLASLGNKEATDVYLISGRSSSWLESHFSGLPIHLIAEHGARCKMAGEEWQAEIQTHSEWKEQVYNIMAMYVRRCPHSFIEEKEFSIVWHYRKADREQGELKAQELMIELGESIANRQLEILPGNKIVEVRNRDIHKGTAIKKVLRREMYDFIFAVGDDKTDEDMFKILSGRENCFTVKVGPHASYAQFNLQKPQMVIALLEAFKHLPVITKTY
jgi:trehalose 6-phosphate synthase/phosphatase